MTTICVDLLTTMLLPKMLLLLERFADDGVAIRRCAPALFCRKIVAANSGSSCSCVVKSNANADPLADIAATVLVHIVDPFDRDVAIVELALARIRADTLVGAGG